MQQGSSKSVNTKILKFDDVAISAHLFYIDPGAVSKQISVIKI